MLSKPRLLAALCGVALAACSHQPTGPATVRAVDFAVTADQIWQQAENITPYDPTALPDMSATTLAKAQQQRLQLLQQLQQVNVTTLSEQNQINHAVLSYRLQNEVDEYRFGAHYLPLNAESGFHSDLTFMLAGAALRTETDVKNYLARLASVPRYMAQQTDWMRQGLAKGYSQPKAVLEGYQDGIRSFISADASQSVFYRPLLKPAAGIDAGQWQQWQEQAKTLILEQVNPAYQRYYDFFVQQYLPAARDDIAATALPRWSRFLSKPAGALHHLKVDTSSGAPNWSD